MNVNMTCECQNLTRPLQFLIRLPPSCRAAIHAGCTERLLTAQKASLQHYGGLDVHRSKSFAEGKTPEGAGGTRRSWELDDKMIQCKRRYGFVYRHESLGASLFCIENRIPVELFLG